MKSLIIFSAFLAISFSFQMKELKNLNIDNIEGKYYLNYDNLENNPSNLVKCFTIDFEIDTNSIITVTIDKKFDVASLTYTVDSEGVNWNGFLSGGINDIKILNFD